MKSGVTPSTPCFSPVGPPLDPLVAGEMDLEISTLSSASCLESDYLPVPREDGEKKDARDGKRPAARDEIRTRPSHSLKLREHEAWLLTWPSKSRTLRSAESGIHVLLLMLLSFLSLVLIVTRSASSG